MAPPTPFVLHSDSASTAQHCPRACFNARVNVDHVRDGSRTSPLLIRMRPAQSTQFSDLATLYPAHGSNAFRAKLVLLPEQAPHASKVLRQLSEQPFYRLCFGVFRRRTPGPPGSRRCTRPPRREYRATNLLR
jgi:hypothetical protein